MSVENLLVFLLIVAVYIAVILFCRRQLRSRENEAMQSLLEFYGRLHGDISKYEFWGKGHTKYWTKLDKRDAETAILKTCENYQPGISITFYRNACYSIRVEKKKKAIYIVTGKENFDFDSKEHFEESP